MALYYRYSWPYIYSCFPLYRIWHKVFFLWCGFRGKGGCIKSETHVLLVIGSLGAMWTILAFAESLGTKLGDLAGHKFTKPESLVQCESMLVIVWLSSMNARLPSARQIKAVGFSSYLSLPLTRQNLTQGWLIVEVKEGEVGHEPWLKPCQTYACHPLTHLVQCEPDEPAAGHELNQCKSQHGCQILA